MAVSISEARDAVLWRARVRAAERYRSMTRWAACWPPTPRLPTTFRRSRPRRWMATRSAPPTPSRARHDCVSSRRPKADSGAEVAVQRGTAVRISTGAPIPDGADAFVPQERPSLEGSSILVQGSGVASAS